MPGSTLWRDADGSDDWGTNGVFVLEDCPADDGDVKLGARSGASARESR